MHLKNGGAGCVDPWGPERAAAGSVQGILFATGVAPLREDTVRLTRDFECPVRLACEHAGLVHMAEDAAECGGDREDPAENDGGDDESFNPPLVPEDFDDAEVAFCSNLLNTVPMSHVINQYCWSSGYAVILQGVYLAHYVLKHACSYVLYRRDQCSRTMLKLKREKKQS